MEPQDVNIKSTEKPIPVVVESGTPQDVNITGTKEPIPVVNESDTPLNVNVVSEEKEKPRIVSKGDNQTLEPTTTHQEDITTAGQRKINLIWEVTQALIALSVVLSNVAMGIYFGIHGMSDGSYPLVLSSSLFLIVGFYFSRTNHAAVGGIGKQPTQPYIGR